MSGFRCPQCGAKTTYVMYSGGNEYVCQGPDAHDGIYPAEAKGLPRATLLRTPEGTATLRAQMYEELTRRAKDAVTFDTSLPQGNTEISTDIHE